MSAGRTGPIQKSRMHLSADVSFSENAMTIVVMANTIVDDPDKDRERRSVEDEEIRELMEEAKRVDELFQSGKISTLRSPASIAASLTTIARRRRQEP
jgi:hypothetical protein